MSRFRVIALFGTVVLAACGGGGSGVSLGVQGPPSAQSIAQDSKDFHLSESDLASLTAAGGTVQIGSATGLGDNSTVLSLDIGGLAVYVAFWESKSFEVAMIAFNDAADAPGAVTKINARIR